METEVEYIYIHADQPRSFLIRAAFGGSSIVFGLYLILVSIGIFCYKNGHDATVLFLALFLLLSSLEIYREQKNVSSETSKNVT